MANLLSAIIILLTLAMPAWAQQWTLVWSDEFDQNGLPNPANWGYEEGFIRGEELQYYTRGNLNNARVENGVLIIEACKEILPNPAFKPGATYWKQARREAQYTSASITTQGRQSWTYGRMEIRAKLPRASGAWPAFWTLGANWYSPEIGDTTGLGVRWPMCGEIDVLEYYGGRDLDTVTANVHYAKDGKSVQSGQGKLAQRPNLNDFHVYAVEWTPERMDFYFDDVKWYSFDVSKADEKGENPFRKPHFIILNLAIGAGGGKVDESKMPMQYIVDYARVYQRKSDMNSK